MKKHRIGRLIVLAFIVFILSSCVKLDSILDFNAELLKDTIAQNFA